MDVSAERNLFLLLGGAMLTAVQCRTCVETQRIASVLEARERREIARETAEASLDEHAYQDWCNGWVARAAGYDAGVP